MSFKPGHSRTSSHPARPPSSVSSESGSDVTTISLARNSPYLNRNAAATASTTSIPSSTRPPHLKPPSDLPLRQPSPAAMASSYSRDPRSRQFSQGFFEPSLPTASQHNGVLSASQIAAQAAMHVQNPRPDRRRSQTTDLHIPASKPLDRRKPSGPTPINTGVNSSASSSRNNSLSQVDDRLAATTAANVAYPRSPNASPSLDQGDSHRVASPVLREEAKPKQEKSRMKLFSKPKHINVSKETITKALVSPMPGIYGSSSGKLNQSTTSLVDSNMSGASSLYSSANASTSTLVPIKSDTGAAEKERHRHHFLSRQKHKELPLSSASSNSRPTDPAAPQPLYSFAPASPGIVGKSMTGFDLRHAGRALREQKKQEKAAAATAYPNISTTNLNIEGFDWTASASNGAAGVSASPGDLNISAQNMAGFGLQNMSADDAWPLLKARLLNVFEGEDLRTPIEDFQRLLNAHISRCISRRAPQQLVDDFRDLLSTGFVSIDIQLRAVPDDRLVPHLADTWTFVIGTVLPFLQAVFLPLDLEFKGRGSLLSADAAGDFWAAVTAKPMSPTTPTAFTVPFSTLPTALDVRTLALATFRDHVILPRHDALLAIFSRLSLDGLNSPVSGQASNSFFPPPRVDSIRPGTSNTNSSGNLDPASASFNSQGSTLLESGGSFGARSRATSNTSAGSVGSAGPVRRGMPGAFATTGVRHTRTLSGNLMPLPAPGQAPSSPSLDPDSSDRVTQTAARMLQCVSVLAGLKTTGLADYIAPVTSNSGRVWRIGEEARKDSGESSGSSRPSNAGESSGRRRAGTFAEEDPEVAARRKMERLAKELKLNWLGRGRMGRNRRGLVGAKMVGGAVPVGA